MAHGEQQRERAIRLLNEADRSQNPVARQRLRDEALLCMSRARDVALGTEPTHTVECDPTHPPIMGQFVEPQMAPNMYLVLANTPVVAPQATSAPVRLEFSSGSGWLVGWRGVAVDLDPAAGAAGFFEQATMAVEAILNDTQHIITNGLAADFAPFYTLFAQASHFTPLDRYVSTKDVANFRFRNLQAVGGNDLQPFLTFAFLRDPRWC